jgi:hypothetical protein
MQPAAIQRLTEMNRGIGQRHVGLVTCPNCMVVMPRVSLKSSEARRYARRSIAVRDATPKLDAG